MTLGIDLGGTNVRIGRVSNGNIEAFVSEPNLSDKPLEVTLDHLKTMIRKIILPSVKGIGIGVPSVLDEEKGIVYNVMNIPSWKEVHLKTILQDEFHIPVFLNNDSNCFALGEKYAGEGKPFRHLAGITLGTGVGAGIIINNELYSGSNTGAGEIGSLPYLDSDFEHYCSSFFFSGHCRISGKEAFDKARLDEPEALEIWNRFGIHLGNLMKAVLFGYDPEAIILGGGISGAFPFFKASMTETMSDFPYPETIRKIQILVSKNKDISVLGAAALVK